MSNKKSDISLALRNSTHTSTLCSHKKPDKNQRFKCTSCGLEMHAGTNAAKNLVTIYVDPHSWSTRTAAGTAADSGKQDRSASTSFDGTTNSDVTSTSLPNTNGAVMRYQGKKANAVNNTQTKQFG